MQWKHHSSPSPKKFKRVSLAGKVMASIFWDNLGVIMIGYPGEGRTMNGAYNTKKKKKKKKKMRRRLRQEEERSCLEAFYSCRIIICSHVASCFGCCDCMRLRRPSSSPVFSRFSPSWLLSVPTAENKSSWWEFRKQGEGVIDAVNEYLRDQDEDLYFEVVRKLEQRWKKCIKMNGAKVSFLGIPKDMRPRTFWSYLLCLYRSTNVLILFAPHHLNSFYFFQVVNESIMDSDNTYNCCMVVCFHLIKVIRQDTQISFRTL